MNAPTRSSAPGIRPFSPPVSDDEIGQVQRRPASPDRIVVRLTNALSRPTATGCPGLDIVLLIVRKRS